jgi:ribosomal protein S18 acetylase RimI-like enzyme
MDAMISWAQDVHGIRAFELEVRSDNTRAIEFYERLGFAASAEIEFEHNDNFKEDDLRQQSPLQRIVMRRFIYPED